jgi:hypothetical protein
MERPRSHLATLTRDKGASRSRLPNGKSAETAAAQDAHQHISRRLVPHGRHASWRTTIAARTIAARQRPEEPPGLDAGLYRIWIEEALRRWLAARRAYRPSEILRASDSIALSNHSLTKQPHQRYQDDYDRQYEPFLFHGYSSPWLTNRQRRRSPLGERSSAGPRPGSL